MLKISFLSFFRICWFMIPRSVWAPGRLWLIPTSIRLHQVRNMKKKTKRIWNEIFSAFIFIYAFLQQSKKTHYYAYILRKKRNRCMFKKINVWSCWENHFFLFHKKTFSPLFLWGKPKPFFALFIGCWVMLTNVRFAQSGSNSFFRTLYWVKPISNAFAALLSEKSNLPYILEKFWPNIGVYFNTRWQLLLLHLIFIENWFG